MVWRGRLAAIARPLLTFALSAATAAVGAGCRRAADLPAASTHDPRGTQPARGAVTAQGPRPARPARSRTSAALRRCFPEIPHLESIPRCWTCSIGPPPTRKRTTSTACSPAPRRPPARRPARWRPTTTGRWRFMRLGRFDEARDALALALAIAPDDAECLELAAELFINRLPPSAERTVDRAGVRPARPARDRRGPQPRPLGPAVAAGGPGAGRPGPLGRGAGAAGARPAS